jgi:PAS domain S-box-containing protein
MKELWGYSAHEEVSLDIVLRRVRVDYRDKVAQAIEDAISKGKACDIEYPMTGFPDGNVRWLKATGRLYDSGNGMAGNFSGTVADITKVKLEVEEERFKNLTLLQQAEAMAEMGSWEYDIATKTFHWSAGMYRLFGLQEGREVTPEIFVQSAIAEEKHIAEEIVRQLELFEAFEHVLVITKCKDIRILKIKSIQLNNQITGLSKVLGVVIDITDTFLSEEKLKLLNDSLQIRNKELELKNEELATFAFVASHDLREPLRKIATYSNLLQEKEKRCLTERGKHYLERVQDSVRRMELLIEDVLTLGQMQTVISTPEDVDLNEILEKSKEELEQQIKQTDAIITSEELPSIKGNVSPVLSLFNNLISNAIKYGKKDVQPNIRITATYVKGSQVDNTNADPVSSYVKLSFSDNGIGFDQRYSRHIFQIFKRLHNKNEYSGTGIGLALCKKIMENHNGFIIAESEPEKGSVFSCYFPL